MHFITLKNDNISSRDKAMLKRWIIFAQREIKQLETRDETH
jgi:hypothetical protein